LTSSTAIHAALLAAFALAGPWETRAPGQRQRGREATLWVAYAEDLFRPIDQVEPERALDEPESKEPELVEVEWRPRAPSDDASLDELPADWVRVFDALPLDLCFERARGEDVENATRISEPAAPVADPQLIHAPAPTYPRRAERLGWQGAVLCALTVRSDGTVERVDVLESSGRRMLDRAAVEALLRWRFRALAKDTLAPPRQVVQRVSFRLRTS
jgi:protein TonB